MNFRLPEILWRIMRLAFTKMNGAGNDFVLADNRKHKFTLSRDQVVRLCDRHRGVGADGVILLTRCESGKADWAWQFYNSDGSMGEMCGNGARCFGKFVQRHTHTHGDFTFETEAGIITAQFEGERVTVSLTPPNNLRLNERLTLSVGPQNLHFINTGVPHVVLFVLDADKAMVKALGPEIRRHAHFAPKGTNVNFVQVLGPNRIRVRTFERGVEGETLACGTGVTASALISSRVYNFTSPVTVQVQGGDLLEVRFQQEGGVFSDVRLTGPADFVYEGEMELPDQ
ncbi:MAG TPA: diaminopimelate epimerase [Verrucomicrobiae bacterium]